MLDLRLRPVKERLIEGAARRLAPVIGPGALTLIALAVTLAAAGAAAIGLTAIALAGWLFGRVLDGLDGPVARQRDQTSDLGGYHDMMADTIGYVAVPLGVAVLLGVFWLNGMSWAYLAAILEKRGAGAATTGEMTSVTMRPALIEGTETIALFSAIIVLPDLAPWIFAAMAALVVVNVIQRLAWATRHLGR